MKCWWCLLWKTDHGQLFRKVATNWHLPEQRIHNFFTTSFSYQSLSTESQHIYTFHFHWLYIEVCFSHSWNCVSLSEIRLLIHRTHYKMHKSQIRRVKKYIRNAGYFFDFVFTHWICAAKHQASDYSLLQLCNTKTSLLYHLWCSCEKLFDKFIQSYQSNMSVLCNWISTL